MLYDKFGPEGFRGRTVLPRAICAAAHDRQSPESPLCPLRRHVRSGGSADSHPCLHSPVVAGDKGDSGARMIGRKNGEKRPESRPAWTYPYRCTENVSEGHRTTVTLRTGSTAYRMRFSAEAGGITGTGRFRGGSADNGTAPCASRWKPGNSGSRPSRPCRAQRPAAAGSC